MEKQILTDEEIQVKTIIGCLKDGTHFEFTPYLVSCLDTVFKNYLKSQGKDKI